MLDRDTLLIEFDEILKQGRLMAEQLDRILTEVHDPELHQRLVEIHAQATHHVALSERLIEIVS